MSANTPTPERLPAEIAAIRDRGYAVWSGKDASPQLRAHFTEGAIPVRGVRHVRQWGLQVDDERVLPGHERTSIPDEELWQIELEAADGSTFEVNSEFLIPAPD